MSIGEIVLAFLFGLAVWFCPGPAVESPHADPIWLGPVCGTPYHVCPPMPTIRTRR